MTELFHPAVTGDPTPEPPPAPLLPRLAKAAFFTAVLIIAAVLGERVARDQIAGATAFTLAIYGVARIVVDSTITKPVRELVGRLPLLGSSLYEMDMTRRGVAGLFTCYVCTGTWLGLGLAIAGVRFVPDASTIGLLVNAAIGATVAVSGDAIISNLEARFQSTT